MTLRLSATEDETLERLARSFRISKNSAAAVAIDLAAPKQNHRDFVQERTTRLLEQYASLMHRLEEA